MMSASRVPPSRLERLPRRSRRLIAVVAMLGLPAMFIWSALWQGTSVSPLLWGPVSFVLIGATLVGAFVLYRYVQGRADLPGANLDERERQLRDRAWILAYQVLAFVIVLLAAAVVIPVLGFGNPVTIDATVAGAIALCLGVLLPLMPAAALAWLGPDPIEDY
jgi:uncharacterized membrane protein